MDVKPNKATKPQTGYCNACGQTRELLTDTMLQESICRVCRSYDVKKAGKA